MIGSESIRVLYIGDDAGLAQLVQKELQQAGHVVDLAPDGEKGLAMFDAAPYDVLMVDQSTPLYDGIKALRHLSSRGSLPPMIMLGGTGDERVAAEDVPSGTSDFVIKDAQGAYVPLLPSMIEEVLHAQRLVQGKEQVLADLTAQARLFENLAMVARVTTEFPALEDTLQNVLDVATAFTGAEATSLFLLDESENVTRSIMARGQATPTEQRKMAKRVMDRGLAGWVARRRQAALIQDITADERWLPTAGTSSVNRSAMVVPILRGETLVGILTLTHSVPGHFNAEHLLLMQAAADQMALALHNAQMYEDQRRLTNRQTILCEVLRTVAGHLDLETVAQVAVETIARLTGWPAVSIVLPDAAGARLVARATAGRASTADTWSLSPEEGIVGRAFRTGQTQYVPETSLDPEYVPGHPCIRSKLDVPIRRGPQVLGVLNLGSDQPAAFDGDDVRMAESLGEAIALALDNARLYTAAQQEITERRRTEEALRTAKEAAEAADRAKSTFLANMSHELRTPLNVIIGYSEMLQEEMEDLGHTESLPDLGRIRSAGLRLLEIVKDVLDLARIEAGKVILELGEFHLADLIRDVEAVVRPQAEKGGNTLDVHWPDDLGPMCADQDKVKQVLFNLLSNAAKFTAHGAINLAVAREIAADGRAWICFQVTDTGIGMAPEEILKLFQPFVLGDASPKRRYEGTGLGLAIAQRFCQMMGGEISVDSELGKGSAFSVRLPQDCTTPVDTEILP